MSFVLMRKHFAMPLFSLPTNGTKQRFPLAEYNRLKKERMQAIIESDENICELRSQLDEKSQELDDLTRKLHKTEEKIRRRKRKVCNNHILFIEFTSPVVIILLQKSAGAH